MAEVPWWLEHNGDQPLVPDANDEAHVLRCLVAEALEVFGTTYVLLTADEPQVAFAANEVQQAHRRFTDALESPTHEKRD